MKKCTICGCDKPYSEFHKQASRPDGYGNWCKPCKKVKKAEQYQASREQVLARVAGYRAENQEKVREAKKRCYIAKKAEYQAKHKAYYEENRSAVLEACRNYRLANAEQKKARDKAYREANARQRNVKQSEYQRSNWQRIKTYQAQYAARRYQSDPVYALSRIVRRRMSLAIRLRGFSKTSRTFQMLGCDYQALANHLESQFKQGMGWENRNEWHIDHIIPLASAKNEEELIALCHYTNLQPLWAAENLSKGARLPSQYMMERADVPPNFSSGVG